MGVEAASQELESFLKSLMARTADATRAASHDEFWSMSSIRYLEERLPLVGADREFRVCLPVDAGSVRYRFRLNSWPEFQLGVVVDRGGLPFYPHFVRRTNAVLRMPDSLRQLEPWSATIEEVIAKYGRPYSDEGWDLRRWLKYRLDDGEWLLTFDLGLLQSVERA